MSQSRENREYANTMPPLNDSTWLGAEFEANKVHAPLPKYLRWLERLTCHHIWELIHPPQIHLEEGRPLPPHHRVVAEGRFQGKPIAILKCTKCDKKRKMPEEKFWQIIEMLRKQEGSLKQREVTVQHG